MFINRSSLRLIDKYYVMINYVMVLLGNMVIHTSLLLSIYISVKVKTLVPSAGRL